jgi:hypothetical protein
LADLVAICFACGAEKDLPLARCPACARVPEGEERELSIVCSTRMLSADQLGEVQARIRRGEPLQPSAQRLARARELLSGVVPVAQRLTGRQLLGLTLANLLFTPLIGYAVWFRYRTRAGPAARQALLATVPVSLVLLVALVVWRYSTGLVIRVG